MPCFMLYVACHAVTRADFVLAGAAPGAALPSDAPGPVEDYYELGAFNDPPPPY